MEKRSRRRSLLLLLLAACCVLYGIKVFLAGSGTAFFVVWLFLGLGFAGLSFAVRRGLLKKLPRSVKILCCVILCICLLFFCVAEGFILSCYFSQAPENLDVIIVLGAQVYESGPSPILNCRLWKALQYLLENPETKCIVSGGQGYNEPFPEAIGMQRYLTENGIEPERILLEPESQTTRENLEFSRRLLPEEGSSVGIVTNNFHVFRSLQTAKRAGFDNVYGIAAYSPIGFIPNNLLREFFALIKFILTA